MARLSKKERLAKKRRKERREARKKKKGKGKNKESKKKSKKRGPEGKTTGYCVRCKKTREMEKVKTVVSKMGMNMAKGVCCKCGCKMCKILGKA